jgi:GTP-binding protein YchF
MPTQLEFADIAGLVRGASKGEGLGNQFLAKIREVDAIVHVLRCFEDGNITHVEGRIDPAADADTVKTELLLADLDSIEKRADAAAKRAPSGDKEAKALHAVLQKVLAALQDGCPAASVDIDKEERKIFNGLQLLTAKPVLYVCNVEEDAAADGNAYSARVTEMAAAEGASSVIISASIEAEVSQLDDAERSEFLADLGLSETGLARIIRAGYGLLDLITFFTVGPKETRAWTVRRGSKAPESAGVIHTPTSSAASSAPRPSPMTILSPATANRAPRTRARCGPRARNTSCSTATSCIFASMSEA